MRLGPTEARLDEGCKAPGPTAKDICPLPRPPGREEESSEQKKNLDREDPKEKGRRAEKEAPKSPMRTDKERHQGKAPSNKTRGAAKDRHPWKPEEGRKKGTPGQNRPQKQSRVDGDGRRLSGAPGQRPEKRLGAKATSAPGRLK